MALDLQDVRRVELNDVQLMDRLRALWRECIDRVRQSATPQEWEAVNQRLAELEHQLSDQPSSHRFPPTSQQGG
jgi:hypothetical protein